MCNSIVDLEKQTPSVQIWILARQFNATWKMIAFRAFLNFSMLQAGDRCPWLRREC